LLALTSLLQLERFKAQDDDIDERLEIAVHQARLNRTTGPAVRSSSAMMMRMKREDLYINLDKEITRDVLQLFTEAGFLTKATTQFSKLIDRIISTSTIDSVPRDRKGYYREHTRYIKEHAMATNDGILSLAENNRLAAERASSILSSVSKSA
jgi:hypothetical protein